MVTLFGAIIRFTHIRLPPYYIKNSQNVKNRIAWFMLDSQIGAIQPVLISHHYHAT